MQSNDRFIYLLNVYLEGQSSLEEKDEFFELLQDDKYDTLVEAHLLASLEVPSVPKQDDMSSETAGQILDHILEADKAAVNSENIIFSSYKKLVPVLSAAVLTLFMAWFFVLKQETQDPFIAEIHHEYHHQHNAGDSIQYVTLQDSSQVSLYPHSTVHYPSRFKGDTREVYLDGKAFFNVTNDPQKPFIVHSRHITTEVLGTSFMITADKDTGIEEVEVKTGRVQVSNKRLENTKEDQTEHVIMLSPNQKVVYQATSKLLTTTIVEKPMPLAIDEQPTRVQQPMISFIYKKQRLSQVFADLEKTYGIDIHLQTAAIGNCLFTGNLTDHDLFSLLKVICLTTQSSYEVVGTKIIINGQGCP